MNKIKPFYFVFSKLPPKEFARVFEHEAGQTKAFILSFATGPEYVESVLAVYKDKELTKLVTQYLGHLESENVDMGFIQRIEAFIREIIDESDLRLYKRNNMIINPGEE